MAVIICGKYENNRSRTENVTERTRFSKTRSNYLEDIGQGQMSLYATHPLILVIICAKYGKNPLRTVDFFSRSRQIIFKNLPKIQISRFWKKNSHGTRPLMIVIICAKYRKNPSRTVYATEWTPFSKSRTNDLENIGQCQGSSIATNPLIVLIICTKYGKNPSWTVDATGRTLKVNGQRDRQTDKQTDRQTDIADALELRLSCTNPSIFYIELPNPTISYSYLYS